MTSHGDQNFFHNASNINISGGTFNNIQSSNSTGHGFQLLLQYISQGAFHDAVERGDPPRCHPHTREVIRRDIMEWVNAPRAMRELILWIYGPAGSGKTAIAQSIAEECERLGLLAASFFFWRTAAGRNDASRFIPTLAYQLSRYIPQMKGHLATAINDDPAIFSRSLATQMRVLVVNPLKLSAPIFPMPPMFAVVDAVDECGPNGRTQSELLHLLGSVASEFRHIPLIFLVTSRPEYDIREAFNGNILSSLTKVLVLDDNYKPDRDIELYLNSAFSKIHQEHCRLGRRLPSPWPTASDVDSLISKASGQFIFAATVVKYIDSPRHNPADRLKTILRFSNNGNETPFALLDELYRFILESVGDINEVLDVMALILLGGRDKFNFTLATAEELLGFEVRSALVDMHSLLFVPSLNDHKLPRFYHASFSDFLMDRSRSLEYCIGLGQGHARLCWYWIKLIGSHSQHRTIRIEDAVDEFIYHSRKSPRTTEIVDALADFDLKSILEGISNFIQDLYNPKWGDFFACVEQQGGNRADVFPRLQQDFDAFILNRITGYPLLLQTHISTMLCFSHALNDIEQLFRALFRHQIDLKHLQDNQLLGLFISEYNAKERHSFINHRHHFKNNQYIDGLLQDKARAGKYFVDGRSYSALAKLLLNAILAESDAFPIYIHEWYMYDDDQNLLSRILAKASIDLNVAYLLRDLHRKLENKQNKDTYVRFPGAAYIEMCGMHQPDASIFRDIQDFMKVLSWRARQYLPRFS